MEDDADNGELGSDDNKLKDAGLTGSDSDARDDCDDDKLGVTGSDAMGD